MTPTMKSTPSEYPAIDELTSGFHEAMAVYGKQGRKVRRKVNKWFKKNAESVLGAVGELALEFIEAVPEIGVSDCESDAESSSSSSSCSSPRSKSSKKFQRHVKNQTRKNCVQLYKPAVNVSKKEQEKQQEVAAGITESLFMSLAPLLAAGGNPAGAMMAVGPMVSPTAFMAPHFKLVGASGPDPTMTVVAEEASNAATEKEEDNRNGPETTRNNSPPLTPQQQVQLQAAMRQNMSVPPQMRAAPPGVNIGSGMPGQEDDRFADLMFPGFDGNSFIWKISMAQCAQFVLSMLVGQTRAAPNTCSLYLLGASWGPSIASGQLWRLILPTMLHANMMHLFFNIFFQLRIGFGMEKQFGIGKFVLLYFICGIVGNMISVAIDPYKLAVGASTSGFGLIGVWLAEILLSWHIMGAHRERSILWILFMLFSVVMMSSVAPNIDIWGHIGGAMAGFLVAIIISDMQDEHKPSWYRNAKRAAALALLAVLLVCGIKIMLFTPRVPIPACGSMLMHSWFKAWA